MECPNLNSFEHLPAKTNTILRLVKSLEGTIESASVNYLFDGQEYITTVLKIDRSTNFHGIWVPVKFRVQTLARLGVELPPGQLTRPRSGAIYTNILEEYFVQLDTISQAAVDSTQLVEVQGGGVHVRDERIGGTEFPLTYLASNQIPSEQELRSNPKLSTTIQNLERAEISPRTTVPKHSNTGRRLIVLAAILIISAAGLFLITRNARWRHRERKKTDE
jgi:hypothetical protein